MKKVGLISDTHGTFSAEIRDFLSDVDVVLHCGDWGSIHTLEEVRAFKPVIGVYGNCDDQDIRLEVPLYQHFSLEDLNCLMIHIGGYPARYDYRAYQLINQYKPDLFFCGHSHILRVMNDPHFTKPENPSKYLSDQHSQFSVNSSPLFGNDNLSRAESSPKNSDDSSAGMGNVRKMLVMNPGACGIMGFHNIRTALRFKVDGRDISDLELGQWPR